jgi:hypothetical protein
VSLLHPRAVCFQQLLSTLQKERRAHRFHPKPVLEHGIASPHTRRISVVTIPSKNSPLRSRGPRFAYRSGSAKKMCVFQRAVGRAEEFQYCSHNDRRDAVGRVKTGTAQKAAIASLVLVVMAIS